MLIPKQLIGGDPKPKQKTQDSPIGALVDATKKVQEVAKKIPVQSTKRKVETVYGSFDVEHKGVWNKRAKDDYISMIEEQGRKEGWQLPNGTVAKSEPTIPKATPEQYAQAKKAVNQQPRQQAKVETKPKLNRSAQSQVDAFDKSRVDASPEQEYTGGDVRLSRTAQGGRGMNATQQRRLTPQEPQPVDITEETKRNLKAKESGLIRRIPIIGAIQKAASDYVAGLARSNANAYTNDPVMGLLTSAADDALNPLSTFESAVGNMFDTSATAQERLGAVGNAALYGAGALGNLRAARNAIGGFKAFREGRKVAKAASALKSGFSPISEDLFQEIVSDAPVAPKLTPDAEFDLAPTRPVAQVADVTPTAPTSFADQQRAMLRGVLGADDVDYEDFYGTANPTPIGSKIAPGAQPLQPQPTAVEPPTPVDMAPTPKMADMTPREPSAPTVTATADAPQNVTSARKAMVADDRAAMGLDELDDVVRKSFGESLDNARKKGYGEAWAQREAESVTAKPRALNDEETAGMVDVMTGLKKQHKALLDQIATEADVAKLEKLRDDLNGIEKQFDTISEAVKLSGTEKGRALASQKVTLNEDFDLISIKSKAKAEKGSALSTAETEKLEEMVRRLDEAEARITQVETQNVDLQAIIDAMPSGAKPGRRIARSQAEIKAARTDALSKWSKSVTSSPLGAGIDPTAYDYKALGQYIATFAEEGIGKAEDVIRAAIANAKANGITITEADAKKGLIEWGTPKKSTRELDNAIFQRDRLRREIRNSISDMGTSRLEKIKREAMSLPRALQATGDLSATLRQGLILGAGNKRKASAAFVKAMRALVDPVYAAKLERELMGSPQALTRKKAGLYIADGETLSLAEEAFMSKVAKETPILNIVSGASERHYTTFLNQLRATVFDDMVARFPDMDLADQKALADFINVSTGRGRIPVNTAEKLSTLFFSPRFMASRIEAPLDAIGVTKEGRAMWRSDAARKQLTKSWSTLIGSGIGLLSLAKMGGAEVSIDPESPDFGKARFGSTSFDVWGGLQQPVRLLAKLSLLATSGDKPKYGKDTLTQIGKFLRYKAAPLPNIMAGVIDKQDAVGQPFLVNKKGEMTPATVGEDAIKTVSPLLWKELANLWTSESTPGLAKLIGTGAATLGVGVNTYERKKTDTDKKKEAEAKKLKILK